VNAPSGMGEERAMCLNAGGSHMRLLRKFAQTTSPGQWDEEGEAPVQCDVYI
jgi:hypothetical protein